MKSKFIKNPESTILTLLVLTVFIGSYTLRIFETYYTIYPQTKNQESKEGQVFNIVYLVIVTITTVGYGDLVPDTKPGKLITMALAIWGALMMALTVASMTKLFEMQEKQLKALRKIDVSRSAAKFIA